MVLQSNVKYEIDTNILNQFIAEIIGRLKEGNRNGIQFGMKSAQRAIRRRQANLVMVDPLLPKCIIGRCDNSC